MGKKKSVALMTLLSIVIVVLCVITAFPSIVLPFTNGINSWNPAVKQYDLGEDLGGTYYAYYYPEGIISETEYETNLKMMEDEDEIKDYKDSYHHLEGGLWAETDPDSNVLQKDADGNYVVMQTFADAFNKAKDEICARFAARGYSDYRVAVVGGYALRIEVPASDVNAGSIFGVYANTGEMTLEVSDATVEALQDKDTTITDLIKNFTVGTSYGVAYVKVNLTKAGREMLEEVKGSLTTQSEGTTALVVKVGDEAILNVYSDHIDGNDVKVPLQYEENKDYVEAIGVLLNSALKNGGYDITFRALTSSEIRSAEPVIGENALIAIYVALLIVMIAMIVYAIVKMGRFGVVNGYVTLAYFIIVALCFGFITEAVFEVSVASLFVFLAGLVLVNLLNANVYKAIKGEFDLGKTVESSVKGGYKKTLGGIIDIYAVLLLGAIALLIGVAGLYTLALQTIICIVTGAFCNLLFGRFVNYTFLSASKNKFKYFRFVREEDDDDE